MVWKGPQKSKTYGDNSPLRSYLSPFVFTVRSGPVWRQDLAILSPEGPRDNTCQLRSQPPSISELQEGAGSGGRTVPTKRLFKENAPFISSFEWGRLLEHSFLEHSCLDQFSVIQGKFYMQRFSNTSFGRTLLGSNLGASCSSELFCRQFAAFPQGHQNRAPSLLGSRVLFSRVFRASIRLP